MDLVRDLAEEALVLVLRVERVAFFALVAFFVLRLAVEAFFFVLRVVVLLPVVELLLRPLVLEVERAISRPPVRCTSLKPTRPRWHQKPPRPRPSFCTELDQTRLAGVKANWF